MPAQLGDLVKDKDTGYSGLVVAETNYLHGCTRLGVQPVVLKDNKIPESEWFDQPRLEVLEKNFYRVEPKTVKSPGGPAYLTDPDRKF